jgi:hypothetical protein
VRADGFRYLEPEFVALLDAPGSLLEYKQINLSNVERHGEIFTPPSSLNGKETGWKVFDAVYDLTGDTSFDKSELVRPLLSEFRADIRSKSQTPISSPYHSLGQLRLFRLISDLRPMSGSPFPFTR